jgi:hypothetical protein
MPKTDDAKAAADAYWQSLARGAEQPANKGAVHDAKQSQSAGVDRNEDKTTLRQSVGRRRM